jgi:hypothetical protein
VRVKLAGEEKEIKLSFWDGFFMLILGSKRRVGC